jgi:polysaccharide pyruvyl transferase WcaK-like protein
MKIGILAYHRAYNFGANLQIFSTVSYLSKHGHTPIIIDWYPKDLETQDSNITSKEQISVHLDFQKNFSLTKRCFTDDEIAAVIKVENIDAIIVGSDAVVQHHPILIRTALGWLIEFTENRRFPNPFWGTFYDKLDRKIPMAMMSVSCQQSQYKLLCRFEKENLKRHIANFSYISSRDDWTSKMFSYVTNKRINPSITPDPVFAFNYNIDSIPSKEEILKKYNLPEKYFLFSFMKDNQVSIDWLKEFELLALKDEVSCVALPFPQGIKFKHPFKKEVSLPLPPIDWYSLIKYSQGYIGNNMHPIIVSLHNGIPCFSFDNYGNISIGFVNSKSSKIYHIMDAFNVLSNRVTGKRRVWVPLMTMPEPLFVYEKITSFNSERVLEISRRYYNEYLHMMAEMLGTLEGNMIKQ